MVEEAEEVKSLLSTMVDDGFVEKKL